MLQHSNWCKRGQGGEAVSISGIAQLGPPPSQALCWAVLWLFAKPGDGHYCKPQKSSTHLSPSFPSFQLGALRHCAVAVCQLSEPKARQQLHATLCKWEFQLTHKNSSEKKNPTRGGISSILLGNVHNALSYWLKRSGTLEQGKLLLCNILK